MMLRS